MSVHTFTNASSVHRILGTNYVVAPAGTIDLEHTELLANDLVEIAAGYFTVSPALPPALAELIGATTFEEKLINYVVSRDNKIIFPYTGVQAGGAAGGVGLSLNVYLTDVDGIIDTFNDFAKVTVTVDGDAVLTPSGARTFTDGVLSVLVTDATAETVTLSLSASVEGHVVSDTVDVQFV